MTPPTTTSSLAMKVDYLWGQILSISELLTPVAARKRNDKPKPRIREETFGNLVLCQWTKICHWKGAFEWGYPVWVENAALRSCGLLNESPTLGISNLPNSCGPGKSQGLPKQDRLLPLPPRCSPDLDSNTILQLVSLDSILFPWKDVLHWG